MPRPMWFALLSGAGIASAGASPTPNANLCEAESCMVAPTNCGSRPECQGCGALCFDSNPKDSGYDLYLSASGLSLQTAAKRVWDGGLAGSPDSPLGGGLLRSADVILQWRSVQPQPPPAPYDWSELVGAVERAYANDGKLIVLLWSGAVWAPSWIYDSGIKKVATSTDGSSAVPNYLDPDYQKLLKNVHKDLINTLRSMDPMNKVVIAFQPCVGSTGDDTPFHDSHTPVILDEDLHQRIKTEWPDFFRNMTLWMHRNAFAQEIEANDMVLLLNDQGDSFDADWMRSKVPGSFVKYGHTGHGFQLNYERYRAAEHAPVQYSLQNGRPIRARAELSGDVCWVHGNVCDPPRDQAWNMYAMANFVATVHLDFWNVQDGAGADILDDPTWAPIWRLLNRYAGVRWARQSPGAWIAFRDGLDAMDADRFDVETFGPLKLKSSSGEQYPQIASSQDNVARAKAICAAHSKQGCTIEDESKLLGGPMTQRDANGTNDVAFGNWRGDYGGFMRLIAPEANTRGWWRKGRRSQKFSRFSRGFADPLSTGSVFPLALDRGIWGGLPLTSAKPLAFRLLFLDQGTGMFQVKYDSQSGPKRLAQVQKSNSGKWRELCATIEDARFSGSGPQGADIWLRNGDTEDDVFGGLEVADASIDDISLNGCDWQSETVLV